MPIEDIQVGVTGGTPGADSNEYTLFDSTVAFLKSTLPPMGINRAQFTVNNTQSGSLKSYFSPDKGTTWNLNSTTTVAANAGITAGPYDFALSGAIDWKLTWLNGGSAQTPWQPALTLSRGQKQASV
jgi:hypothetical protein